MTQPSKTTKLTKDEVDRLISDYQTKQDEQAQETRDILGISQMHVSRLQRKAVKKLREALIEDPSMELM